MTGNCPNKKQSTLSVASWHQNSLDHLLMVLHTSDQDGVHLILFLLPELAQCRLQFLQLGAAHRYQHHIQSHHSEQCGA